MIYSKWLIKKFINWFSVLINDFIQNVALSQTIVQVVLGLCVTSIAMEMAQMMAINSFRFAVTARSSISGIRKHDECYARKHSTAKVESYSTIYVHHQSRSMKDRQLWPHNSPPSIEFAHLARRNLKSIKIDNEISGKWQTCRHNQMERILPEISSTFVCIDCAWNDIIDGWQHPSNRQPFQYRFVHRF